MRLSILLLLFAPILAVAQDEARSLLAQPGAVWRIVLQTQSKPGEVLWELNASRAVEESYRAVIFQGKSTNPGIAFEARRKLEPWQEARLEWFPNGRFWGKFTLSGKSGEPLDLRIIHRGAAPGTVIELFAIEMVSGPLMESRTTTVASTIPVRPQVRSRDAWRALPPTEPYQETAPWRITVHHTDGAQPITLEDAVTEMQIIQRYHQEGRGWIDIGYHFLIDGAGNIFAGRPENARGAHVMGNNEGNLGISLMGGFHPPRNLSPTPEQLAALGWLANALAGDYEVSPERLLGHRDYRSTDCPGDRLYPALQEIREELGRPEAPSISPLPLLRQPCFFERFLRNPW